MGQGILTEEPVLSEPGQRSKKENRKECGEKKEVQMLLVRV